ncbi:MAG: DUF1080 domain-containing protein [Verrucomicrobiales bacterium]|nr:DUF1080 domain-containing protein [Verrucomicrobiales bacterium]
MNIRRHLLPFLIALPLAVQAQEVKEPFNGKDLSNWDYKAAGDRKPRWAVGKAGLSASDKKVLEVTEGAGGEMINNVTGHGQSLDIFSKNKFGDIHLEVELMVPQGSNSGIYVMGEYEVQVLDSFGKADKEMTPGDIGAIYSAAVPKLNAAKAPGEWQKFVIDFRAPRFDAGGKKTENAKFVRVELNGKVLHENVEMNGPTPGGVTGKEAPEGPVMFQGDHGAVAYRNLKISALK